jgi:Tfp pilus assembly protein PilE
MVGGRDLKKQSQSNAILVERAVALERRFFKNNGTKTSSATPTQKVRDAA